MLRSRKVEPSSAIAPDELVLCVEGRSTVALRCERCRYSRKRELDRRRVAW
jgi:hypothetical protein